MPGRVRTPRSRVQTGAQRAGASSRVQVTEMQRARLLAAAVRAVEDLGYARATVERITSRARVSRRTFYELFANREECLAAVMEEVVRSIEGELAGAGLEGLPWRERVRGGLSTILSFFDREPAHARLCVVQSLRGGQDVLERREQILRALAAVIDEGRLEGARGVACPPLTAEGLVGAALAIVHARLLRREREPLTGLLSQLMGMIVLPYLGPAAARREQRGIGTFSSGRKPRFAGAAGLKSPTRLADTFLDCDPLEGIPMRLTYRTARVLGCIAERPGASNRAVGERAGVVDQGQISKLLARLERLDLIVNGGEGRHAKGEPNAWTLTPTGWRVAQGIRTHTSHDDQGKVAR